MRKWWQIPSLRVITAVGAVTAHGSFPAHNISTTCQSQTVSIVSTALSEVDRMCCFLCNLQSIFYISTVIGPFLSLSLSVPLSFHTLPFFL